MVGMNCLFKDLEVLGGLRYVAYCIKYIVKSLVIIVPLDSFHKKKVGYYTISLDPDAARICTIIFFVGKVLLQETTYGNSRLARHIPGKNVRLNGNPRVFPNLFG